MTADSLSDAQKGQVRALSDAFGKAHAAQLDSLRTIMEAARQAREAGKARKKSARSWKLESRSMMRWRPLAKNSAKPS